MTRNSRPAVQSGDGFFLFIRLLDASVYRPSSAELVAGITARGMSVFFTLENNLLIFPDISSVFMAPFLIVVGMVNNYLSRLAATLSTGVTHSTLLLFISI